MAGPFQVQTRLTAISMAVKPMGFIADEVCPRVNAMAEEFTWTRGKSEELFTIPDTRIGRTSRANRVEFGAEDRTGKVEDHGLEDAVPVRDINRARAQRANWDPEAEAAENTGLLVHLARERRVADLLFTASSYRTGSAGTTALSGSSQFDDYSDASKNPIDTLVAQIDKMRIRPNLVVFGQGPWTKFRRHPKVVGSIKPSGAGNEERGSVNRAQVAEELEVDDVQVGVTWYQSAKKGQDPSYARLWGNSTALLHRNRNIQSTRSATPTFAVTAEWLGLRAGTYDDESIGTDGAVIVKVVDQVKELVMWDEAGFLFTNVID